jgi:hypothetical protein
MQSLFVIKCVQKVQHGSSAVNRHRLGASCKTKNQIFASCLPCSDDDNELIVVHHASINIDSPQSIHEPSIRPLALPKFPMNILRLVLSKSNLNELVDIAVQIE